MSDPSERDAAERGRWIALASVIALLAITALIATRGGSGTPPATGDNPAMAVGRSPNASFAELSRAHSNRCELQAPQVMAMPQHMRLQGSCCFPMDRESYRRQLRGLGDFGDLRRVVPADPYDVPVSLAKRLLGYRDIPLTRRERTGYELAIKRSDTHGPCCCPCWRWQAFRGQARYLLHRRHLSGTQVGRIWSLEEGCGGPSESKT
jgi:hypothetical protein